MCLNESKLMNQPFTDVAGGSLVILIRLVELERKKEESKSSKNFTRLDRRTLRSVSLEFAFVGTWKPRAWFVERPISSAHQRRQRRKIRRILSILAALRRFLVGTGHRFDFFFVSVTERCGNTRLVRGLRLSSSVYMPCRDKSPAVNYFARLNVCTTMSFLSFFLFLATISCNFLDSFSAFIRASANYSNRAILISS